MFGNIQKQLDRKTRIAGLIFVEEEIMEEPDIPLWWLPIGKKETLLHFKIFECATIGCDTIFIVIPWHLIDFYNNHLKNCDLVEDPHMVVKDKMEGAMPDEAHRQVKIFTIPLYSHNNYWQAFSKCYATLYTTHFVNNITKREQSDLFGFEKFYFTFSSTLYDLYMLVEERKYIFENPNETTVFVKEGKSIFTNDLYPFLLSNAHVEHLKSIFNRATMKQFFDEKNPTINSDNIRLPTIRDKKYVNNFTYSDIFGGLEEIGCKKVEIPGEIVVVDDGRDFWKSFRTDVYKYYFEYPRKKFAYSAEK